MSFVGLLYCRLFGLSWNECTREIPLEHTKYVLRESHLLSYLLDLFACPNKILQLCPFYLQRESRVVYMSRVLWKAYSSEISHLVAEKARMCCFYPYKEAYMSLSFKQTVDSDIPIPPQMVDQIINDMSHFKEMVLEVPNWWRYLSVSCVVLKILTVRHRAYSLPISWSPTIAHSLGSSNVTLVFGSRVMNPKYRNPTWPCYVSL